MFRTIVMLIVGIAIGYFLGFGDGQKNEKNVVERLVARAGGTARGNLSNDIDSKLEKANR